MGFSSDPLRITVLGSGTSMGVPTIGCHCDVCSSNDPRDNRLRPSILVRYGGRNVLIDTTPDFRTQALRAKINRLDAILFTHNHADHSGGAAKMQAIGATLVISQEDREQLARTNQPGLPQVTYHGQGQLFVGGKEVQLREFCGHTRGDTVAYLAKNEGMTVEQFHMMVNTRSGLLGVSEISSDIRDLLVREEIDPQGVYLR